MPDKVNQHTVAQFYLRRFAATIGDKVLWQFSKTDPGPPMRVTPRKAAAENYFYSVQRPDGTWDHSIEDALARLESETAPALVNLSDKGTLTSDERMTIAFFMGVQIKRVRAIRDRAEVVRAEAATPEATIAFVQNDFEHLSRAFGEQVVNEYIAKVSATGTGIQLPRNFHLRDIFRSAMKFAVKINRMSWTICRPRKPFFFVTSDNPAYVRIPGREMLRGIVGIDRDDLGAELNFPISASEFLIGRWPGSPSLRYEYCTKSRVHELNRRTVLCATEHVFSRDNSRLVQSLVEEHKDFRLDA